MIFAEKLVHLQAKSPPVGLHRTMRFQFPVPELMRVSVLSPALEHKRHPLYTAA